MGLYIETRIRAPLEELWRRTQDTAEHARWDVRFTRIDQLPGPVEEPRRFRYATRVLPLLTVAGTGVSAGERHRPDGTRTSALRFASPERLSLIAEGRGYWRYVPEPDGTVRFLTGYDYRPRWGRFGRIVDRLVFRPLMGWATAWSFDRLRLWCERGVPPERALLRAIAETVVRAGLVAAAIVGAPPVAAVAATVTVLLVPPLPSTPAARRCRRRPTRHDDARPPALLRHLDRSGSEPQEKT
ncbi:hypothetical protein [Streptomyces alkaliterrae]|uniref:SRPBCC family protein n=1 Tax=Streptomyces alkaliterrae TaxID=2213162 RepID=A0A5P0YUH3_9ACTN|nr:hypothetical protein [Streptomyces alkaliterrae]MBB1253440.1 hypothetical protein [Streptomyces alkaliterrae]MBB1259406.1 hypothetical protein [Streptomyces alkaliterrae]MQS03938.1 hypothetical protein [Streptomyces alkaliterrae]